MIGTPSERAEHSSSSRNGVIEDSLVFVVQEKLSNYSGKMRPGTYLLSTAYTPTRIMGILAGDAEQEGVTS